METAVISQMPYQKDGHPAIGVSWARKHLTNEPDDGLRKKAVTHLLQECAMACGAWKFEVLAYEGLKAYKGLNKIVISLRRTDFAFHFKICLAMHSIRVVPNVIDTIAVILSGSCVQFIFDVTFWVDNYQLNNIVLLFWSYA